MSLRPFVVAALAAAACQRPAEQIDVDVMNLTPAPVEAAPVSATRATFEAPRLWARATATPSLEPLAIGVHVTLEGGAGDALAVEFTTPDGLVYERQTLPIADAPFEVQAFDFVLPVAGTWIESQQLYGEWRAHVLVGDRELLAEPFTVAP